MVLEETIITPELIEELKKHSERTPGKGLFEDCSDNFIIFCRHMIGIDLYAWQKLIALDMMAAIKNEELPREFVVLTSRQIGKTTFAALFALWVSVFNKLKSSEEYNSTCGIISASDLQAKLVLREVKKFMQIGNAYCRNHYSREKDDLMDKGVFDDLVDPDEDNNKQTISFKAQPFVTDENGAEVPKYGDFPLAGSKVGTRLNSYPPTTSVLGQTFAYLHEDEAGRTDRFTDEAHSEFLYPTGDARNAVRLYTSTPWVTSGFFYELADPDDIKDHHNYKRYLFTIEAIKYENPKQYKTVTTQIEQEKLDGKMDAINRKYYCKFVKGETSYFDPDDVDTVFDDDIPTFTAYDGACDIGVDFGGQVKSRSVITVSAMMEDKKIVRLFHKSYDVGKDNNLLEDLEEIMKAFPKWDRIIPDECPQGDYMIRKMREKGWNVHPMNFRTWKVKKFGAFRAKMKRGLIKSYKDDNLKIEMKALEFMNSSAQSKISAPSGYNDDLIDSFVMSSFFYLEEKGKLKFFTEDGVFEG